jgi:two-component system NtrC family sensor kinase
MPGLSGIETLKKIKIINPDIEVLILSAHSNVNSARDALEYGAYAYIDKPFNNKNLRNAVRKGIIRNRKLSDVKETSEKLAMVKAQLIESEKFSIIGQLVAGVSHEINNPLTAIIGYSELAAMFGDPSQETKDYINRIKTSAMLCKSIVEKLLSFSRKNEDEKGTVDTHSVIENSIDLAEFATKKCGVKVSFEPVSESPPITANFFEIQQVFLNIINNACHALTGYREDNRKLTIRTEYNENAVLIIFEDNGPGIPEENLKKIFEPLFTTKPKGEGTGLGLSICFEIVKNHGGNIFVGNTDEGARFIIELPVQGAGTRNEFSN